MTREEAIEKYILPAVYHHWNEKVCKEIEQILNQEPCEDTISREAVLNIINERKFVHTMEYGEYIGADMRGEE